MNDIEKPTKEQIFEEFKEKIEEDMLRWITNYPYAGEITLATARAIARRAKEIAVTAFMTKYSAIPH